jgi:hypothetical protein
VIPLWPAIGQTVLDENGDVVPVNGISIAAMDAYYSNLKNLGLLLDYDPLDGPTPPTTIGQTQPVLAVDTDAILGGLVGYRNAAQARTSGATVTNAGDGDTWNWSISSTATPGADVLAPDVGVAGRWLRDTTSGLPTGGNPGDVLWTDLGGDSAWRPFPLGSEFVFDVRDYGGATYGDGTVNDLPAFQAALAAAINAVGVYGDPLYRVGRAAIYVPYTSAHWRFNSTFTIQNCKNIRWVTDSNGNAEIRYYGTLGQPMIVMDGTDSCSWTGFNFSRGGNKWSSCFSFIADTVGEYETTNCKLEQCKFTRGQLEGDYSVSFGANSGRHQLINSFVSGYDVAGLRIENGAYVYARSTALSGIYKATTTYGILCPSTGGGSFTFIGPGGGGGGYHKGTEGTDFKIEDHDGPIYIRTWNSEPSTRIMRIGTAASSRVGPPITLEFSRLTLDTQVAADGRVIIRHCNTPLHIPGNHIVCNAGGAGTEPGKFFTDTTHPQPTAPSGSSVWNSGALTAYPLTPTASGGGTINYGVIEYPNTYTAPPISAQSSNHRIYISALTNYYIHRLPVSLPLVGIGDGDTGVMGRNLSGSQVFVSGTSQTTTVALPSAETDTAYFMFFTPEASSGTLPDGFDVAIVSKAVGGPTIRFSHAVSGFDVRLTYLLVR